MTNKTMEEKVKYDRIAASVLRELEFGKNDPTFREYRDPISGTLLCKAKGHWHIEVLNKKTRSLQYTWPTRKHHDIWPKWLDFLGLSVELRCPDCNRLLCKAMWVGLKVEIKCTHCKTTPFFEVDDLYNKSRKSLPLKVQENLIMQIKNLTS